MRLAFLALDSWVFVEAECVGELGLDGRHIDRGGNRVGKAGWRQVFV